MGDINSDTQGQSEGKRPILTTKKATDKSVNRDSSSAEADLLWPESPKAFSEISPQKKGNNFEKTPKSKKTVRDILLGAFSEQHGKDGNIKPAKISKSDLKSLNTLNGADALTIGLVDTLINSARVTDRSLDCLLGLTLSVMEATPGDWKDALFDICVKVASGVWILRHKGSIDLFRDVFEGHNTNQEWLTALDAGLKEAYQKRMVGVEKTEVETNDSTQKKILEKQKKNLLLMGALWLLHNGKCDPSDVIEYLNSEVITEHVSKATLTDVALFLAGQWSSPDSHIIRLLALQAARRDQIDRDLKSKEDTLLQKDQQIAKLQHELENTRLEVASALDEVRQLQEELVQARKQAENQQLDERAARTHLRDSEGKVRAKAFNLLSEEVIEPLRLSLSALQRENPKTKSAIHQIELVVESIERDLQWFKE